MMPEHRVTRDTFDALVLDKIRNYRLTKDEAIRETLRELQLAAPSRSGLRLPEQRYEADFQDEERIFRSKRGDFPMQSRRELEDEVSASLHFVFPDRRRSRSPPISDKIYFKEDFASSELRGRDFNPTSRESSWSREQERARSRLRDVSPLRPHERDFEGGRLGEGFRGIMGSDYDPVRSEFRGRTVQGHEGSFTPRGTVREEESWSVREPKTDVLDDADVFSKVGSQLIHWAEFNKIKHSPDFYQQHGALFLAETEACAKTLASFKCSLKNEHRDFCFNAVRELKHPALKSPKVDNELLNLLVNKNAVQTKNDFFELIKPFDKSMMSIQDSLLKSVIPLLMACNTYELNKGFDSSADLRSALENTISLCRKSLVLFGQTYSLATWFRQERILETVGLRGKGPRPSAFPNLDDSYLFGKEYMSHLKTFLESSSTPFRMKSNANASEKKKDSDTHVKSEAEDSNMFHAIDDLLENAMDKKSKTAEKKAKKPPFWFLFFEKSQEFKYYQTKLAELRKLRKVTKEAEIQTSQEKTPEELATESMRAMRYAKKVLEIKRKLSRGLEESRRRKLKRSSIGTQTVLSSSLMLKLKAKRGPHQRKALDKKSSPSHPNSSKLKASVKKSGDDEFLAVDAATKDTAEKLAQFVAQMGPEIEKFSMENSESNPEFWFLHAKNSPAYKYYQVKIKEFRQAMGIPDDFFEAKALEEAAKAQALAEASKLKPDSEVEQPDFERLKCKTAESSKSQLKDSLSGEQSSQMDMVPDAPFGDWQHSTAFNDVLQGVSTAPVAAPALAALPRKRVGALKVGMLPSKRVCLVQDLKVHDPVRIAYERPQGRPNKKKVPKPKDLVYEDKKITDGNVGFKMLQKMGWREGQGLGTVGTGIKEPVKVGSITGGEGLGVEEPKEDSFESFRQRMIQMYREKIVNS
ncbi:SURP and G-patch domain-containing protein 2-like [Ambystoma mexicanum]|uniref:SURP and G-patch domain-containing protein 2-like n=1 Tax=Ambystoma mexicanum TaxID=8296 RepID=UPI0037E80A4E